MVSSAETKNYNAATAIVTVRVLPKIYQITYFAASADSGSAPEAQIKIYDVPLVLAGNSGSLQKQGYVLIGWNEKQEVINGLAQYQLGSIYSKNESVDLYPVWEIASASFVIDGNGGSIMEGPWIGSGLYVSKNINFADEIGTLPTSETINKTGHDLVGWNTKQDGSGIIVTENTIFNPEEIGTIIYAIWSKKYTQSECNSIILKARMTQDLLLMQNHM